MKFKELFERYANGEASPEERKIVEDEIEKNEIINEYLAEKIDLELKGEGGFPESDNSMNDDSMEREILYKVQRAISRKLRRVALSSVLIVLLIFLGVQFGISPLMNVHYYNPQKSIGKYYNKLMLDMSVYTELFFPGIETNYATSEPLGFGGYNVKISQQDGFKGFDTVYDGKIVRGKLEYLQQDFYRPPYANAFHFEPYHFEGIYGTDNDSTEVKELGMMPETSEAKVYVSFMRPVTMEEISSLIKKYNSLYFAWVAVMPSERQPGTQIGFEPTGNGIIIEKGTVDDAKYPDFELANENNPVSGEVLETHFKSLIKYMEDDGDFLRLINTSAESYGNILKYVETNGVKSYGVLVMGKSSDILKLRKDPMVDSIMIDDIKLSPYSH